MDISHLGQDWNRSRHGLATIVATRPPRVSRIVNFSPFCRARLRFLSSHGRSHAPFGAFRASAAAARGLPPRVQKRPFLLRRGVLRIHPADHWRRNRQPRESWLESRRTARPRYGKIMTFEAGRRTIVAVGNPRLETENMVTRVQPAPEPLLVDAREAASPAVLNVKQVAALLNVSPHHVYRMVDA